MRAIAKGISRRKSVCGGEPYIAGTRLPARSVYAVFMDGVDMEDLRKYFACPLTAEQVEDAIRFEMRRRRTR